MDVKFILIITANSLLALSAMVRDMLILRITFILATCTFTAYHCILPIAFKEKLVLLAWDALFMILHGYHSVRIFLERRPIHFTEDEIALYSLKFRGMPEYKFNKLLKAGQWKDFEPEEILLLQNKPAVALILLYKGAVRILKNDQSIATLKAGAFLGEMSIISKKPISATVIASEKVKTFYWPSQTLTKMLEKDSVLAFSLSAIMGEDMAAKLGRSG